MDKKKNKNAVGFSAMMYGYVQPHNDEIENAVLGVMLKFPEGASVVKGLLLPTDFYQDKSIIIATAIYALDESGVRADQIMVLEYLKNNGLLEAAGGVWHIVSLQDNTVSDLKTYCLKIKEYSLQRQVVRLAQNMISASIQNEDVFTLIEDFRKEMDQINDYMSSLDVSTLDKIAMDTAAATIYRTPSVNPILTGLESWDEINGELFGGGVYVVAARPGMGKTAFVIQLIRNMAKKIRVGFVNIEMTDVQLCTRYACNYAEINNDLLKIKPGQMEIPEDVSWRLQAGIDDFSKLQLELLSDQSEIDKVISKMNYWVKTLGVRLIILDYMQILTVRDELMKYMNDVQALNYISKRLRDTAKRLKVPLILLSQLNRELYKRGGNKEPGLSDLKGSGMIEEIAYQIVFIHRPEYYGITEEEFGEENTKNLTYLIIAKHRDGRMGRIKLRSLLEYSKFIGWESEYIPWIPVKKTVVHGDGEFDEGYDEAAPF